MPKKHERNGTRGQGLLPFAEIPETPREKELKRRRGNTHKCYKALEDGPKTNIELMHICGVRYGARIHELRNMGCVIETTHCGGGLHEYNMTKGLL